MECFSDSERVCMYCFRESCDALMQSPCVAGIEKASFPNCTSLPSRNSSESCSLVELKSETGETSLCYFSGSDSVCQYCLHSFWTAEGR